MNDNTCIGYNTGNLIESNKSICIGYSAGNVISGQNTVVLGWLNSTVDPTYWFSVYFENKENFVIQKISLDKDENQIRCLQQPGLLIRATIWFKTPGMWNIERVIWDLENNMITEILTDFNFYFKNQDIACQNLKDKLVQELSYLK